MKRRHGLIAAGAAALGGTLSALAQPAAKVHRIGVLSGVFPLSGSSGQSLIRALAAVGLEEGRNVVIDYKFADGKPERLPGLAAELVAGKPDVIMAFLNPEAGVLKRATSTIPIVMLWVSHPVETGLIASLARPGANITGTTTSRPETAGKMMQVLRDAVPGLSRVTCVSEPDYPGMALYMNYVEQAAAAMGLRLNTLAVRKPADLDAALAAIARDRPDAVFLSQTGLMISNRLRVIEFMSRMKIPALYSVRGPVTEGGLVSYSPDFSAILQRSAWMADKILKGAKPGDIPVEEPAKFILSINMKAAKSIGLAIPQALLLQADEVLE